MRSLLIDRIGAMKVKKNAVRLETKRSARFCQQSGLPLFLYRLNARNHRKIAVIDGKIGYVGGFNIAKEYLGKKAEFGPWKDYHLRMTGEGVADLQHIFYQTSIEKRRYHSRTAVCSRRSI